MKSTVMFCFFITVCILALAKTADNQDAYQAVNTQSLPILDSAPRDLQRFLQSPVRSNINRLRNTGSGNLNLPSPPVTVIESLPSQQLFVPPVDIYSPNYRTFTDVARYSNIENAQYNDNIYLENRPPLVIINEPTHYQEQRAQYGTEESPGKSNQPDVSNANFNNANNPSFNHSISDKPPVNYAGKYPTNENEPVPQRKGDPQSRPNINKVNKTNVHERRDNNENYKVNFEDDKSTQTKIIQPRVTNKPNDLQIVNGTNIVNVTLDQRASFDGDKCPTGHIRVNGSTQCIPTD